MGLRGNIKQRTSLSIMVALCATLYSRKPDMQVAKAERLLDAPVPDVTLMGVAFRVLQGGKADGLEKVWGGIDLPQRGAEG